MSSSTSKSDVIIQIQSDIDRYIDINDASQIFLYRSALEDTNPHEKLIKLAKLSSVIFSKNFTTSSVQQKEQTKRLLSYLSYFVSFFESLASGQTVSKFFVGIDNLETALGLIPKSFFENMSKKTEEFLNNFEPSLDSDLGLVEYNHNDFLRRIRDVKDLKAKVKHLEMSKEELKEHFEEICNLFEYSLVLNTFRSVPERSNEKITEKDRHISYLRSEKEELEMKYEELSEKLDGLNGLAEKLDESKNRETLLQKELEEKNLVIDKLKSKISEMQKAEESLSGEYSNIQSNFEIYKRKTNEMSNTYRFEIEKLQEKINQHEVKSSQREVYEKKIDELNSEVARLERAHSTLANKYDEISTQYKQLKIDYERVNNLNEELVDNLRELNSKVKHDARENTHYNNRIAELETENKELKTKLQQKLFFEAEIRSLQSELLELKTHNSRLITENKQKDSEITKLEVSLTHAEDSKNMEKLLDDKTATIQQLMNQISILQDARSRYNDLLEKFEELDNEVKIHKKKENELNLALNKKDEFVQKIMEKCNSMQEENRKLKEKIADQFDNIQAEELKSRIQSLTRKNDELEIEKKSLSDKLVSTKELLRKQREQKNKENRQVADYKQIVDAQKVMLKRMTEDQEANQKLIAKLKKKNSALEEELNNIPVHNGSFYDKQGSVISTEDLTKLRDEKELLKKNFRIVKNELDKVKKENDDFKGQMEIAKKDKDKLEKKIESMTQNIKETMRQIPVPNKSKIELSSVIQILAKELSVNVEPTNDNEIFELINHVKKLKCELDEFKKPFSPPTHLLGIYGLDSLDKSRDDLFNDSLSFTVDHV